MKTLKYLALAAALAGAAGCGSSKNPTTTPGPDAQGTVTPGPDGGTTTTEGGTPVITMVGWVTDLVDQTANPAAAPDTVDDKEGKVMDTSDPGAFDGLLK
jgi:hypothetical protein